MMLRAWSESRSFRPLSRRLRRLQKRRFATESLEDRTMLASFTVNSTADAVDATPLGDGIVDVDLGTAGQQITLRAAIMEANALIGDDVITLPAGTYLLTLAGAGEEAAATGDLDITDGTSALTINGAGAGTTIIDAGGLDRVFHLQPDTNFANASPDIALHLSGMTITGGNVSGLGGGIFNNFATLSVTDSVISGNTATSNGGAIADVVSNTTLTNSVLSDNVSNAQGGGIWHNGGLLTIDSSTISDNLAGTSFGGGLLIRTATVGLAGGSVVDITNTTLSGNSAPSGGGGIANFGSTSNGGTTTTVTNSTISGNSAGSTGGGVYNSGEADMILLNSTITLNSTNSGAGGAFNNVLADPPGGTLTTKNTIFADNSSGSDPDVRGPFISQGNNLVGDGTGSSGFGASGDLVGTSGSPIDALLGPLQNNGGPTSTHALLGGSPAIDAGTSATAPATDQRGIARPQGAGVDIGAYEEETVTNQPPTIAGQSFNLDENQTSVGTVVAADPDLPNDTLVFTITGLGPDDASFSISVGGALSFNVAPDFESPADVGGAPGDNVYLVEVRVTDSAGASATATMTVDVLPVNDNAPLFTSANTANVVENSTSVQALSATDADLPTQTASISITGSGPDDGLFQITGGNQLEFLVAPDFETPLDANTDNVYEVEVEADDGNGLTTTQTVSVTVLNQASITGVVFVDVDQDGLYDANEPGIDGVVIELRDASGASVLGTATTSDGGFYLFEDLDPETYRLQQIQPTGVDDGAEVLGNLGGTIVANDNVQLTLARIDAVDYAFAELGQQVTSGDTATIGFWQNKHGQQLITSGGQALADWLTGTFSNVFGNEFDTISVADFYKQQLFKQKAQKSAGPAKVDAQFMAVALATYFTSSNLAGTVAADFGFNVTDTGIGTKVVNMGDNGEAFDVADYTNLTIMQLLLATNALTDTPDNLSGAAKVYDQDGDGTIDSLEAALRAQANEIYSSINESGDI